MSTRWFLIVALLLVAVPVAAQSSESPLELTCSDNARSIEGDAGTTLVVNCPADCDSGSVWGTDVYTDDSVVCRAAQHAGVITVEGGIFALNILGGQEEYPASEQNDISSSSWGSWNRSFSVTATEVSAKATPQPVAVEPELELTCSDNARSIEGDAGTTLVVNCPVDCDSGSVWGTDVYTDDSAVCRAAQHAGVITVEGGVFALNILDGQEEYPASEQNDISSSSWGSWNRSFSVAEIATKPVSTIVSGPAQELACADNGRAIEGEAGTSVLVSCPADCSAGSVWGTDVYTDDSTVCRAAQHAGIITESGGEFVVNILEGQEEYPASEQNGISSSRWGSWDRSFSAAAASADGVTGGAGDATVITMSADLPETFTFSDGSTFSYPSGWTIIAAPSGAIANSADFRLSTIVFDGAAMDATTLPRDGGVLSVLEDYYGRQGAEAAFDPTSVELFTTEDGRALAAVSYTHPVGDAYAIVIELGDDLTAVMDTRNAQGDLTDEDKDLMLQIAATFAE